MDEIITMSSLPDGLSRWIMIAFLLCVLVCAAALIDMWTGIDAAKANKEKIMSHGLRKTVKKIIDYLRIVYFFLLIDILGAVFVWYNLPYCAILATLGTLLIEGRSVIENSRKKQSAAGRVVDAVQEIIACVDSEKAQKIIEMIKEEPKYKQ
jgi:flagellar basal body-associated protein FliL